MKLIFWTSLLAILLACYAQEREFELDPKETQAPEDEDHDPFVPENPDDFTEEPHDTPDRPFDFTEEPHDIPDEHIHPTAEPNDIPDEHLHPTEEPRDIPDEPYTPEEDSHGTPDEPHSTTQEPKIVTEPFSSNVYVDEVLEKVRFAMKEKSLDPLKLPTKVKSFQKKVIWKVTGGIKFENGVLEGLSSVRRKGRTNIVYKENDVIIEANLSFNTLQYSSRVTVWFGIFKIKKTITASVSSITAYMRFSLGTDDTEESSPRLEDLDIREVGKVKARVKGLGPLGWTFSKVTSCLANILKKVIANKIEGPIEKLIRRNLHHVRPTL